MGTKLDQLYSLRKNFTIIGLTGRTGSGCSDMADVLSQSFGHIDNIRKPNDLETSVFQRKYQIVYNYTSQNWKSYKVIEYKKVLFLMLLPELLNNPENSLLYDYYRFTLRYESSSDIIDRIKESVNELLNKNSILIRRIASLNDLSTLKDKNDLLNLNRIFWSPDFNMLADKINEILFDSGNGIINRIMLLHHTANNFRKSGQPFKTEEEDTNNIYKIAKVINRIIKATKQESKNESCHVVIDSLRNSLEINFFKERF
jgi:hypothetical protein